MSPHLDLQAERLRHRRKYGLDYKHRFRHAGSTLARVPVYVHLLILLAISLASRSDAQADTVHTTLWDHPVHIGAFVGESFPARQWRNSFEVGDDGALSLAWPVTHGSGIWLEGQFNGQSQLMINTIQSAFQATGAGASIYSLHSTSLSTRATCYSAA
jgi:hypothetical protein